MKDFYSARFDFEQDYLVTLLCLHKGNVRTASGHSAIERSHLWRMIKKHGIVLPLKDGRRRAGYLMYRKPGGEILRRNFEELKVVVAA